MAVIWRLCVPGVCAAVIAGCGGGGSTSGGGGGTGGSGGGQGNPTVVTVTFSGAAPGTVAASVGGGAFAVQTLSGSALSLSIPNGTSNYAVAYLCPAQVTGQTSWQDEYVWEASTVDGTSVNANLVCPYEPSGTGALTGNLDASVIPGVYSFWIDAQNGETVTQGVSGDSSTTNFSVPAPTGSDRVLVLADTDGIEGPVAAKNFANQTVPGSLDGGSTVVFGTTDETVPEAIAYNNIPSGYSDPWTYVDLELAGSALQAETEYASSATTQYLELPASATEQGDLYNLSASVNTNNSACDVGDELLSSGGPVSFTFPAPWSCPSPTPAALPSFDMSYSGFSGTTDIAQNALIQWNGTTSSNATATYQIHVEATANYQSGSTTLAIPNLSAAQGFLTSPASGTKVYWEAWITQQNYGFNSQIPSNATWSWPSNIGTFTVP